MSDPSTVISVRGLVYSYPGTSRPAVDNVSFDVQRGEVFGLLGPSGAGKSTIQRILTRQLRSITAGEVAVFGKPLGSWNQSYYEKIGVGFELPNHYLRLTARENLKFFASLYRSKTQDIDVLLDLVGLKQAADKRVSEFSKGMMMRLNFVRALLHRPELLFLDEPTSGLDPVNAGVVKGIIRELRASGVTVVLTTHNMLDVDELCDRVGFMVQGQMRSLDRTQAVKERFGKRSVEVTYADGGVEREAVFPLDGLGANATFLALLNSHDIRRLHSQEASLDEVFTRVTGATLHAEDV